MAQPTHVLRRPDSTSPSSSVWVDWVLGGPSGRAPGRPRPRHRVRLFLPSRLVRSKAQNSNFEAVSEAISVFFKSAQNPPSKISGYSQQSGAQKELVQTFFGASPREKLELVQTFIDPKTCIFLRKAAHKQLVQRFILGPPFP